MFNYNRKKYRFLSSGRKSDESILDRPEFSYPEPEKKKKNGKRENGTEFLVNYLRKPHSENGIIAFLAAAVAAVLTMLSAWFMVRSFGNPPLSVSAMVLSAILFALYAVVLSAVSCFEKDRNRLFPILGLAAGGSVLVAWLITMMIGAQL